MFPFQEVYRDPYTIKGSLGIPYTVVKGWPVGSLTMKSLEEGSLIVNCLQVSFISTNGFQFAYLVMKAVRLFLLSKKFPVPRFCSRYHKICQQVHPRQGLSHHE